VIIDDTYRQSPPKKTKLRLPVKVAFMKTDYCDEHLVFLCQNYSPRGGEPDYQRGKYNNVDSQDCSQTVRIIDGVKFHTPFTCHAVREGAEYWPHFELFHMGTILSPYTKREITAGMKWLFPGEKDATPRKKS
jgi:hypothetical protein